MLASTKGAQVSGDEKASVAAMAVLQSLFFVNSDPISAKAVLNSIIKGSEPDDRSALAGEILGFVLSQKFVGS
jgi:hypothetical protein